MFLQFFQHIFFFFLHVGDAGSFRKPLSKQEEADCFEAMAQGDRKAREKLILHNMRLVAHITKKYGVPQPEQEELISIGTVGLVKAVDSFDNSKGARFATYASRCIEKTNISLRLFLEKAMQTKLLFQRCGKYTGKSATDSTFSISTSSVE